MQKLAGREAMGRYKGSALGLAWTFIQPLLMLVVYTFVFSQVFRARWGGAISTSPKEYAIILFAGLITFNVFSEIAIRAPLLVVENPNYVKKVIFPLEILVPSVLAASLFHAACSLLILIGAMLLLSQPPSATILFLPIAWAPLILGSLALGWLLSALGVFIRDISQLVAIMVQMLMFLSPIFYSLDSLPPGWQSFLTLNPLSPIIEATRDVLLFSRPPSTGYVLVAIPLSVVACELAFRVFQRAKPAFADVL
ncbi:MAG: ABC transporter permease [Synechococcus sp.]